MGAGTDYTKCFDLIPQAISMALMEEQGIDEGVLRALSGMYRQLRRMFKIKGCLGAWWAATNGVLQGCPLSVIVINALTTTWKRIIDDVGRPVVVTTKEVPPAPKEEEIPSCYWTSYGTGLDQIWVWRCVQPCCCWEQGWVVDGEHAPPPNPDNGGDVQPPRRPDGCRPWLPTPAEKVWGRLGVLAMPTPASTEHSRALLRSPPLREDEFEVSSEEPGSPILPRNLFGTDSLDGASDSTHMSEEGSVDEVDAAPGSRATISAEGYADDTYMLTAYLLSLLAMLAATSKWLTLTGQEVNASKSLAFAATHSARGPPTALEATLDGVRIPTHQEFRQLAVGVRTVPRRGTGPPLHKRIKEGKAALRKTRTIPGGFDRKATVAAVMIVAAWGRTGGCGPKGHEQLGVGDDDGDLGTQQTVQGKGGGVCPTAAGAQGGTINGGPVQADVLACTHRTRSGHIPSCHTSSLGAYGGAQRHGPTRSGTARIPAPRLAQPPGVVELDHAANRDLGAPGTRSQGVCGAFIPRVLEGASPGGTGETETETLRRHGSTDRQGAHTERTGALRHGARQVDAATRDGGGAVDRGQSASEGSAPGWQLPLL